MGKWFCIACEKEIMWRSLKVALVVGTLLMAINYGDKLVAGSLKPADWGRIVLTYFVPFGVATYASVQTVLRRKD